MQSVERRDERLFIGVPVPEETRLVLARKLPKNIPGRAVPIENWHFTLRFLGATDSERRDRLLKSLSQANFGHAFDVEFDVLGAFPNARRARVIWVGIGNGKERLERLAEKAEQASKEAGFDAEPRKFSAHLTISRMKQPEQVSHFVATARAPEATMRVSEVILYRSEMGGAHSRYSRIASFGLA